MRYGLFLLFFLIPVSAAVPYSGIFSILDEKYISNITELPHSIGLPSKNWQISPSMDMKVWIDITGFSQLIYENGEFYVPGNPQDYAIINTGFSSNKQLKEKKENIITSIVENNIISKLTIKIKWDDNCGYSCQEHRDEITIQDIKLAPMTYPALNNSVMIATEYNNSFNPRTIIHLKNSNAMKIVYTYKGQSITHYLKTAHVEETVAGIYFANISDVDIWTSNQPDIQQMRNEIHLVNTSDPDWDNFSVIQSSITETREEKNISVMREDFKLENSFPPFLIYTVALFGVIFGLGVYLIKRK